MSVEFLNFVFAFGLPPSLLVSLPLWSKILFELKSLSRPKGIVIQGVEGPSAVIGRDSTGTRNARGT